MFVCSRCGCCCTQLKLFDGLYDDLDRGDGVCRFYNPELPGCSIYQQRPLKCRVDESYTLFQEHMSYEEYIEQMNKGCEYLRREKERCRG